MMREGFDWLAPNNLHLSLTLGIIAQVFRARSSIISLLSRCAWTPGTQNKINIKSRVFLHFNVLLDNHVNPMPGILIISVPLYLIYLHSNSCCLSPYLRDRRSLHHNQRWLPLRLMVVVYIFASFVGSWLVFVLLGVAFRIASSLRFCFLFSLPPRCLGRLPLPLRLGFQLGNMFFGEPGGKTCQEEQCCSLETSVLRSNPALLLLSLSH